MATAYQLERTPAWLQPEAGDYEYDYLNNPDVEEDQFLGKAIRRVTRSVRKTAGKAAKSTYRTAKRGAKTAYKAARKGSQYAGKVGKLATRLSRPPGLGAAVKFGRDVVRGRNVANAFRGLAKSGINDLRERMRYAQIAASFVPGVGTGVAATLGAANALAAGRPISDALIEGARAAIPGGPLAQAAFDVGVNLAKGRSLSQAALNAARNQIPPGGRAAFDTAVALGKGQSLQRAAWANAGRLLPASPYVNNAASFARYAAQGKNLQQVALSRQGRELFNRLQHEVEFEIPEDLMPATTEDMIRVGRALRSFPSRQRKSQPRPIYKQNPTARPRPRSISKPPRIRPANVRRPVKVISRPPIVQVPQPASEYMRWVQRALNDVLGSNLIVDGIPDRTTRNAIRDFQKQNQLPIDGIAGPVVKETLIKARADFFKRQKSAV